MQIQSVTILVFLAALVQLEKTETLKVHSQRLSYNPCFSGSSSATEISNDEYQELLAKLQSLFFWQL